jgi:hypothetical protein
VRPLRTFACIVALGIAALIACGAPDSFDGLVGGLPDAGLESSVEPRADPTLAPPRPIAPLSMSWVNTLRPRFRWALAPSTIGVRLELCRTRSCDGEKKTFLASGTELVLPEDLAPGIWFWRLLSTTPDTFGTTPSFVWEVLVRGPPASAQADAGASFTSNGTFVDVNGDGRADLLLTVDFEPSGSSPASDLVAFLATSDDSTTFAMERDGGGPLSGPTLTLSDTSVSAADVNGDGLSDFVYADDIGQPVVFQMLGSPTGFSPDTVSFVATLPLANVPNLHEAGDLDGDGFSDVVIATRRSAFAEFGTPRGLGAIAPLESIAADDGGADAGPDGGPVAGASLAITGGFDRNGDGLADVALSDYLEDAPFYYLHGAADRKLPDLFPEIADGPMVQRALRFAAGDFDGDGLADVAFTATTGGKPTACIVLAADPLPSTILRCLTPEPAPAGFGSSITACDVDADGRDELLIGSTSGGIEVARLVPGSGTTLAFEHIPGDYGARLTTILPGRPGPGVWAATRPDGRAIAVFKGTALVTTLFPSPFLKRFGQTIR